MTVMVSASALSVVVFVGGSSAALIAFDRHPMARLWQASNALITVIFRSSVFDRMLSLIALAQSAVMANLSQGQRLSNATILQFRFPQ
jgi:hypothetical protein